MTAAALRLRAPASPWTTHLAALGAVSAAILAFRAGDLVHMVSIWWTSSTYAHCLLVAPIIAWLVSERLPALRTLRPHAWPLATVVPAAGASAILLGEAGGIATLRHAGLVMMLAGAVPALLGRSAGRLLRFPLLYAAFLVPVGEELVPALQLVTAHMCMALLGLVGIPAHLEGVFITVPYGWFEVAEACSGVKFLVAMAALAVLVAELCFRSWARRLAFVLFALAVPIVANGLRAFATIWVARDAGVESATGFDHLVYGWLFFAVVIALTLGAAWPFFDRGMAERPAAPPNTAYAHGGRPWRLALALAFLAAVPALWLFPGGNWVTTASLPMPQVPGWSREMPVSSTDWQPSFQGMSGWARARYRHADGTEVDVKLVHFYGQEEGQELVGHGQGIDPDWSWSGGGASIANGRADRFTNSGAGREVVAFYRMGDVTTGDPAVIKWHTLKARLLLKSSAGDALLVSSATSGPPAASRPAIDRFLAAAGGAHALLPR